MQQIKLLIEKAQLSANQDQVDPRIILYTGMTPFSVVTGEDCDIVFSLRSLGFESIPKFGDGGFRRVWKHSETSAVFTYCEGDLVLALPVDSQAGLSYWSCCCDFYAMEDAPGAQGKQRKDRAA